MEPKLKWLEKQTYETGTTFTVPWKIGTVTKEDNFYLDDNSNKINISTEPLAYWNDGSVKWTKHSCSFETVNNSEFTIKKSEKTKIDNIIFSEDSNFISIDNGRLKMTICKNGENLIKEIFINKTQTCSGAKLICINEKRNNVDGTLTKTEETFISNIHNAVIETLDNNMICVKITGKNKRGIREWVPFNTKIYIYKNQTSFKIIHTFFYDGNPNQDYIKGIGLKFSVPLKSELYNRHIRIAGDKGFFVDSPKGLDTWRIKGKYADLLKKQVQAEQISFDKDEDKDFVNLLDNAPVWNDFKIVQNSPDSYVLSKRTKEGFTYIKSHNGKRAMGQVCVSDANGGMSIKVKDFWQKYPSEIEVKNTSLDNCDIITWLYSPSSEAMDLRHYTDGTHVVETYEGFAEMRSTPYGIANTSQLFVSCFEGDMSSDNLCLLNEQGQNSPILVCTPEYYYEAGVFGVWSLPDSSNENTKQLENELNTSVDFIFDEIEQRKWYGFWDYGDIMRDYSASRHNWRYDVGGFAWNNNEFDPNIFLWLMFLRTGDAKTYRLAESFTRHASEVDQYHFGEYKGFGSRHNVVHWGCGCKEARISMASLHKYFYFLTGDNRICEIIEEVKDIDYNLLNLDPMRAYFPAGVYPTHARYSPDWAAFTSNWMFMWEKDFDLSYLEKIKIGIDCLKNMPNRLCSGPTYGYDPHTSKLIHMGDENSSFHMGNCFGASTIWFELAGLLKDEKWNEMIAEYGSFYSLTLEEKQKTRPDILDNTNWGMPESGIAFISYAASYNKDEKLATSIMDFIKSEGEKFSYNFEYAKNINLVSDVKELPWANSGIALRGISLIIAMELLKKYYE